jgi:hypothetical protein
VEVVWQFVSALVDGWKRNTMDRLLNDMTQDWGILFVLGMVRPDGMLKAM